MLNTIEVAVSQIFSWAWSFMQYLEIKKQTCLDFEGFFHEYWWFLFSHNRIYQKMLVYISNIGIHIYISINKNIYNFFIYLHHK